MALRAFLVWFALIPLAILNGGLRDRLIARFLGSVAARALSGLILSGTIFGWTWLTIGWIGLPDRRTALAVGAAWLLLTVSFEFGFGRFVAKKRWVELLRAYRGEDGELWPLVLLVVALAPFFALWLRRN